MEKGENMNEIEEALKYPNHSIKKSYLFRKNKIAELEIDYENFQNTIINNEKVGDKYRNFIISYGANASPHYLNKKFKYEVELPIIYININNYDVVYANYICSDGTIPTTMIEKKGSQVNIFVYPINERELTTLNESENIDVDYELKEMISQDLEFLKADKIYYYKCIHGELKLNNMKISCSEIVGKDRHNLNLKQYEIQKNISKKFEVNDMENFILENIQDNKIRNLRNKILKG